MRPCFVGLAVCVHLSERRRFGLRLSIALGTALFFASNGLAQAPSNQAGKGMMAAHDHGEITAENPAHRYLLTVFTLPEMETELGLSAQQTGQLRQYKQDYMVRSEADDLVAAEAAGKMEAVLSPEQLAKLAAWKPADLHKIAMGRISAAEMTRLMELMKDRNAEKSPMKRCEGGFLG